jgi:hypothetical protein
MRRAKSLRIGVHHANAVVWGPVYRTHLMMTMKMMMRQKTVTRALRRRDAARGRARLEDARGRRSARHDGVGDGRASAASATTTVTDDGRDGSASQIFIYKARRFCFFGDERRAPRSDLREASFLI